MSHAPAVSLRTAAVSLSPAPAEPRPAGRATAAGGIIVATINRPVGDTGVHAHTRALLAGLRTAGESATEISAFGGSKLWPAIFAVRRIALDRLNPSWSTRWHRHWHRAALVANLTRACRSQPPAAVIAQCPLSADAAMTVRRRLGGNYHVVAVCHFNHSEATEYRDKGELNDERAFTEMMAFEQRTLCDVDAVVYVSSFCRQQVEQQRGILPRRSAVIANGIDRSVSTPPVDREALGLHQDDVVLVNVGSLETRKNQSWLLDVFTDVHRAHPAAKLLLIGDGPDRPALAKQIHSLGLSASVQLLGFRQDVPAVLPACDLYVHSAVLENCPVVLLEAARASLAVATVPAGGAAELLSSLGAGEMLDPNDRAASAARLGELVIDADRRRRIGRACHAGFLQRFTREAMIEQYRAVIQQASGGGRPA